MITRSRRAVVPVLCAGLLFLSAGPVLAGTPTTTLVSVSSTDEQGNGNSFPASISADGRYIAFGSGASNLVPGDTNGVGDVFVRDRTSGITTRVGLSSAEKQGSRASSNPSISADGRYIAFTSTATNLVPGDTNGYPDVFVRDRSTGTTTRVSVSSAGKQGNGWSVNPSISADGRYIAFESDASNLVRGDTNGGHSASDVFVRDRRAGTTTRVNVSSSGKQEWGYVAELHVSAFPSISADGRYVAFASEARNLVPGDTNWASDVFVRDRTQGTTTRLSVSTTERQGNDNSVNPSISADGRFVAFVSSATNLVPGDWNRAPDVFVRDRRAGTTTRVNVSSTGKAVGGVQGTGRYPGDGPSISAHGRYIAFAGIFVRDRTAGTTTCVSVSTTEETGNGYSDSPAISADGRFVAFASTASNLVSDDTNDSWDVVLRGPLR